MFADPVARPHMERNDKGRLRIGAVSVDIQIESPAEMLAHFDHVLAPFEIFLHGHARRAFRISSRNDGTGRQHRNDSEMRIQRAGFGKYSCQSFGMTACRRSASRSPKCPLPEE